MRRNFLWTLAGNGTYAASQFVILMALAKLGSAGLVGVYTLALALAGPAIALSNLKLNEVQATDAQGDYSWSDYLSLRLLTTAAAIVSIAALALASGYRGSVLAVVVALSLSKGFEALSDVSWGVFLRKERNDLLARSQILRALCALGGLAGGVWLTGDLFSGVCAMGAAWAVVAALDLASAASLTPGPSWPGFRWPTLRHLAWTTLPLGLTSAVGSLQINAPRYLLEQSEGVEALGVFAGMAYPLVAGGIVLNALGMVVTPRLAKLWFGGDRAGFSRLTALSAAMGAGLGAIGLVVIQLGGEQLLTVLYDSSFTRDADVFPVLMLSAAIAWIAVFLGAAINAMRQFKIQVPVHSASLAVVLVGCLITIPTHGVAGAAWSIVAGSATTTTLTLVALLWLLRQPPLPAMDEP